MIYKNSNRKDLLVASDLQRGLLDEIGEILADVVTTRADEQKQVGFNGFIQQLPVLQNDDEDRDQFFPYYIVRLMEANTESDTDFWTWTVAIYLGIHDEGAENQGHFSLLNAMTRITNRFGREAVLGSPHHVGFRCLPNMNMTLQDEDTYPYFFGAVLMQFAAPKITREDPLDVTEYEKYYHPGRRNKGRGEEEEMV